MKTEKQPFEDVSPIKDGVFPSCHFIVLEGICSLASFFSFWWFWPHELVSPKNSEIQQFVGKGGYMQVKIHLQRSHPYLPTGWDPGYVNYQKEYFFQKQLIPQELTIQTNN